MRGVTAIITAVLLIVTAGYAEPYLALMPPTEDVEHLRVEGYNPFALPLQGSIHATRPGEYAAWSEEEWLESIRNSHWGFMDPCTEETSGLVVWESRVWRVGEERIWQEVPVVLQKVSENDITLEVTPLGHSVRQIHMQAPERLKRRYVR